MLLLSDSAKPNYQEALPLLLKLEECSKDKPKFLTFYSIAESFYKLD